MGERINADDSIPLIPWVSPPVNPFAHTSSQTDTRGSSGCILCACVLFFAYDNVRWKNYERLEYGFDGWNEGKTYQDHRNVRVRAVNETKINCENMLVGEKYTNRH
jgi:hypothetical protein